MSILIKDVEMPTTCGKCRIKNAIECDRWKLVRSVVLDRHRDCPLIPVPPHGRLNVIEPYMQHDEDDGFDELIKPSDIDYMHTPSVEEIIKGYGE